MSGVIAIDPGHSYSWSKTEKKYIYDPGACYTSQRSGGTIREERKVLAVATATTAYLNEYAETTGCLAIMTRIGTQKISNSGRIEFASRPSIKETCKCWVSIHYNSCGDETADGTEILYHHDTTEKELALAVSIKGEFDKLINDEGKRLFSWRKFIEVDKGSRGWTLINGVHKCGIPIVLVECGFLSNRHDRAYLTDLKCIEAIGAAIGLGILKYGETLNIK